ncbi:MAG: hypothetical protein Q4A75_01435 [Peptostreptococcaceae bacterium]|nr:hypothetical protein [Peptostreptococcaceae bacterium]
MRLSKEELELVQLHRAKTNRYKKRFEFSKIMLVYVTFFVTALTAFSAYIIWETKDTSALSYLIPAWFTEFGIAPSFYYNKAKHENLKKMGLTEREVENETRDI